MGTQTLKRTFHQVSRRYDHPAMASLHNPHTPTVGAPRKRLRHQHPPQPFIIIVKAANTPLSNMPPISGSARKEIPVVCNEYEGVSDLSPPPPTPPKQTKKPDQFVYRARPVIGVAPEAKIKPKIKPTGVKKLPAFPKPDPKNGCTPRHPSSLISKYAVTALPLTLS